MQNQIVLDPGDTEELQMQLENLWMEWEITEG